MHTRITTIKHRVSIKWHRFLVAYRLSTTAICNESRGFGLDGDYHDIPDINGELNEDPTHVYSCKYCGKRFRLPHQRS